MKTIEKLILLPVVLNLFDAAAPDPNTQTTGSSDLSPEMKTYYDKELISLAEPELIHDQFGQKKDIPAGSGKTIEFRQFDPLPELTTPLTEGVTPDGQSMKVKSLTATVSQYGGYVTLSDILDMTAIDPMILEATKLIGSQAGRTLDTITREVINAGTNVQYARNKNGVTRTEVTARSGLSYTSAANNCNLAVDDLKRAVRTLKDQDAKPIDGSFIGVIHPDVAYDLMNDPEWLAPKE